MSTFTQENPFEFEGNWVGRRNESGQVVASFRGHTASIFSREGAEFCHAFVEAERNEWHEDGTGFRKGRWIAVGKEDSWHVRHDDFEGSSWASYTGGGGAPFARDAAALLQDFLNWHEANYPTQPAEPTGLGAVVEVSELEPCKPGATERLTRTGASSHDPRPWVVEECVLARQTWTQLLARGPVTVLSEGWTK